MTVKEAADQVIRLAEARNAEHQAIDDELGGQIVYKLGSSALSALQTPRPAETALIAYIESLPVEITFKLRTLMYVGRGDANDILDFHADLMEDHSEVQGAIISIVEKSPLPSYLRRGLERAATAKIDLDASWPTTSAPKPARSKSAVGTQITKPPPRAFPPGRDPIENGAIIFEEIANEWTGDSIVVRSEVAKFFDTLQEKTGGLVVLDFIDLASWDQIEGHVFDPVTGYLELYWHDFRAVDAGDGRSELDSTFFPASLYGLLIQVQEIRIIRGKGVAAFLLCGHSLDHAEIKKHLAVGSSEHKAFPDSLFSNRFVRRVGDQLHVFNVLTSPLYTTAILPKDPRIPTSFSRAALFEFNLQRVRSNLQRAADALQRVTAGDADAISEKVNTIRRNWEQALKIEVVYRDFKPKGSYSDLMLGDLIKLLKAFSNSTEDVGRIIGLANALSHDAGRAIDVEKVRQVAAHVATYVEGLRNQIRLNSFPPSNP